MDNPLSYFNRKYVRNIKSNPSIFLYQSSENLIEYTSYDIYHNLVINFENKLEELINIKLLLIKYKTNLSNKEKNKILDYNYKIYEYKNQIYKLLLNIVSYYKILKKKKYPIYKNCLYNVYYDNCSNKWNIKLI